MQNILIIKIGSSVLLNAEEEIDKKFISRLAKRINIMRRNGQQIILVISGAVAYGSKFINLTNNGKKARCVAAGIGQIYITSAIHNIFIRYKLQLAQILLTKNALKSRFQQIKIKKLLISCLNKGFIPFINENDVLDLNSFGGNDLLAAKITCLVDGNKLYILSTMNGSKYGVGGGRTKQKAIDLLAASHISANILNGRAKNLLRYQTL